MFHAIRTFGVYGGESTGIWALARFGVLIFFVHTSFVLMKSLSRMNLPDKSLFLAFYIRRAFRIYPLSMLCVLVVCAARIPINAWGSRIIPFSWPSLLSNLALTQNLTYHWAVSGPLWSLPYEIQMYVILPLIFVMSRRWRSVAFAGMLWAGFVAAAFIQPRISDRLDLAQFAPCFMGGILAFQLSNRLKRGFMPGFLWPVFIAAVVSVFVIVDHSRRGWVECLLLGAAIPCFAEIQCRWWRLAAHLIAKYSYGIYLSHMPLLWVAFARLRGLPMAAKVAFVTCGVFLCPVALYHLVERPAIGAGIRISRKLTGGVAHI